MIVMRLKMGYMELYWTTHINIHFFKYHIIHDWIQYLLNDNWTTQIAGENRTHFQPVDNGRSKRPQVINNRL